MSLTISTAACAEHKEITEQALGKEGDGSLPIITAWLILASDCPACATACDEEAKRLGVSAVPRRATSVGLPEQVPFLAPGGNILPDPFEA